MLLPDIIINLMTHSIVFVLGVFFDRLVLSRIFVDTRTIEVQWGEIVKIATLLITFAVFMAAVVSAQFYGGTEPSIWLSLGGVFSFGSLIGERDFFIKIISGYAKLPDKDNKK